MNWTGGADTIRAGTGDDVLIGGAGNDALDGGSERDLVFGDNVSLDRTAKWLRCTSSSSTVITTGIPRSLPCHGSRSTNPGTTWAPSMITLVPSTAA